MEPAAGALERWIHGLFVRVRRNLCTEVLNLWSISHQRSAGNHLRNTGTGDLRRLPPALKIRPSGFLFCYWFCNREVKTFPNLSKTEGWSLSGVRSLIHEGIVLGSAH